MLGVSHKNQGVITPLGGLDKSLPGFGGDPISDTDSGSLSHFPHHCGIGGLFGEILGVVSECVLLATRGLAFSLDLQALRQRQTYKMITMHK